MTDVVITGMGATTPLGGDLASTWAGMLAGRSGGNKTGRRPPMAERTRRPGTSRRLVLLSKHGGRGRFR